MTSIWKQPSRLCVAIMLCVLAAAATGAELPKTTQALLAKLKLSPEILKGLDQELQMPSALVEGAKKEGALKIGATWDADQFRALAGPFLERYPFIKIKYARATRHDRVIKPLLAFQTGRVITDVISGIGSKFPVFKEINAVERLDGLPNWKNVPDGMKHPDGLWVGQRLRYWCMAYNTNLVEKKDLPRVWEDLVNNPRWYGQKIGLGNRPNLWLIMLWGAKGEDWVKDYVRKLFSSVKPQLRKEGMNALLSLTIAGEFDAAVPAAAYRTSQRVAKGAPIAWHCPEPVPLAISEMIVMRTSKKRNSALMFVNWFLSKEGQISQFAANKAPPVHRELQTQDFLAFPEQIVGKKIAFRDPSAMERDLPKLLKFWDALWFGGQGLKLSTVKATITKLRRRGRRLSFKVGGETHTVKISGSRTSVVIKGIDTTRGQLKVGMTCEITYPGNKEEAKKVSCD